MHFQKRMPVLLMKNKKKIWWPRRAGVMYIVGIRQCYLKYQINNKFFSSLIISIRLTGKYFEANQLNLKACFDVCTLSSFLHC